MPRIIDTVGDIFSAPSNSILLHACNCRGVWGSGVALEFRKRFPCAYDIYNKHCNTGKQPSTASHQHSLLGSALLIPPQSSEGEQSGPSDHAYWIACLFTSVGYGRTVSSPSVILHSTEKAMQNLYQHITVLRSAGQDPGEVWTVRINSGKFGVEWEKTKRILEECKVDLTVVREVETKRPPNAIVNHKRKRSKKGTADDLGYSTKDAAAIKVGRKLGRKGAEGKVGERLQRTRPKLK